MLKEKVIEWIDKTFGKPKHRDRFEMTYKVSEKDKQGARICIEELGFVFQRSKSEAGEKEAKQWKAELEEICGTSLRGFHMGNESLFGLPSAEDIKKGAPEGSLVTGKAMMMNVMIYKKTFIHNLIQFPGRRH